MTEPFLGEWTETLAGRLGIDPALVDIRAVLDLARDAAHGVERPAAPLTTFIVGYAAGATGRPVAELMSEAAALAVAWPDRAGSAGA